MTIKESNFIRLREIAKMAKKITSDNIVDRSKVNNLHKEVNAMLRYLYSSKRFFKRL